MIRASNNPMDPLYLAMRGYNPQPSRFSGGLGGLFGGMGGFNPYMGGGFNPMMGRGFNPMMGGGFNPYMGGGFNPMMGRGFNPYMGGGFNPMMGGGFMPRGRFELVTPPGFEGYDFNAPIGEPPAGATPTPPPSIADLYGGLDEEQKNAFLQQFGLAPTPPPPESIERPDVDERDMFDSGSVPGEPGFSIEEDPRDMMAGTLGGRGYGRFPLGSAGPEYLYDDAGNPIMEPRIGGGFNLPGFPVPGEMDENTRRQVEGGLDGPIGGGYLPPPDIDIDLEKIRDSLAKIEPIIPGISLPEPQPMPVRGPGRPQPIFERERKPTPGLPIMEPVRGPGGRGPGRRGPGQPIMEPMPALPINEFDNPLFNDPKLGSEGGVRPMPAPMPAPPPGKMLPGGITPMPMPGRTVIPAPRPVPVKDPVRTVIGPGGRRISDPRPPGKIQPLPIKRSVPPVRREVPMPMPSPIIPAPRVSGPYPGVVAEPARRIPMPKPAPINRGIGGVRGGKGRGRR